MHHNLPEFDSFCYADMPSLLYREGASERLKEYFIKIGGREKIFEAAAAAQKSKKRGRPSSNSGTPQVSSNKRSRNNGDHPLDSDEPQTAKNAAWKPPAGSWEEHIAQLDACEDEDTHKLMVYLTWKNGHKTQHTTDVIYKRCPQKVCFAPLGVGLESRCG